MKLILAALAVSSTRCSRPCLGSTAPVGRNPAGRRLVPYSVQVRRRLLSSGDRSPQRLRSLRRYGGGAWSRSRDADLRQDPAAERPELSGGAVQRRVDRDCRQGNDPRRKTGPELRADCARVRRAVELHGDRGLRHVRRRLGEAGFSLGRRQDGRHVRMWKKHRHVDGHADRLGHRVRTYGAHAHGRGQQDGEGEEGREDARVTFQIKAQDDRDGTLPVTCAPKSGSRFRIGKTRVTCVATDSSANAVSARFTVTVRRVG